MWFGFKIFVLHVEILEKNLAGFHKQGLHISARISAGSSVV
jgi:hypothetical protein